MGSSWWYNSQIDRVEYKLDRIAASIDKLLAASSKIVTEEAKMAVDLTSLTAEVANNTTVTGSIVQVVNNLVAALAAIPPSNDPTTQAALDALRTTLATNDSAIAAAVVTGTPVPAGG